MNNFLQFVEIRTKVASVIPFLAGTLVALYSDYDINGLNLVLLLSALLFVDMGTTALNHYMDYKRAVLKEGYHYEHHNPVAKGVYNDARSKQIILGLFSSAAVLGIGLAYRTDIIVFVLGGIAFLVGLGYSVGPLPFSRTILGELLSGGFMGMLIPFMAFYIHTIPSQLIKVQYIQGLLQINIKLVELLPVLLIGSALAFLIGNIMLANNICDRDEDIANKRFTLPVVLGSEKSLLLYRFNIIGAFLIFIMGSVFSVFPIGWFAIVLLIPWIYKNTVAFVQFPSKKETFGLAVKNFIGFGMIINLLLLLAYGMNKLL